MHLLQTQALLERQGDAPAGEPDLITVPLRKEYVPVLRKNRTVAWKTAYLGTVFAGSPRPQHFTVLFDTGSAHFILPSVSCLSDACRAKSRYNRALSQTALDIEEDGTPVKPGAMERDQVGIIFGTGEVSGEFIEERACLRQAGATPAGPRPDCVGMRVVLATTMTDDPFKLFQFDGVLGLGLDSLALAPDFSFFHRMTLANPAMQPVFAVYLGKEEGDGSEIAFGGVDPRHLTAGARMAWAPITSPESGYWQLKIHHIRIGNETLPLCEDGSCRAIADTGTSLLGVPRQSALLVHRKLTRSVKGPLVQTAVSGDLDCREFEGPSIFFDLEDFTIRLDPKDYSRPAPARMRREGGAADETGIYCRSSLMPVDMLELLHKNVFIWGEPLLRRYYTAYDWGKHRIGFALPADAGETRGS